MGLARITILLHSKVEASLGYNETQSQKKKKIRAQDMAQQLRMHTPLTEDLSLVPSTHAVRAYLLVFPVPS